MRSQPNTYKIKNKKKRNKKWQHLSHPQNIQKDKIATPNMVFGIYTQKKKKKIQRGSDENTYPEQEYTACFLEKKRTVK